LAVTSFVLMIFLAVLAAGALMFAWMLLLAGMVQALSLAGLELLAAFALVAALHVGLAWALWRLANRLGRHMEFRSTRKLLGEWP
jgi:membrane protein implicated in regulation of membrane protease activity